MKFEEEKLQLGKFIACGAFGAVYEGMYNGQKVAVKALELSDNRQEEEAFLREASLWSKLDHPNVAKFIGTAQLMLPDRKSHGRKKLHRCLVSEFLDGGALNAYLCETAKKGLQLKTVIQLALDIARGLAYMHSEKVVHHDVKTDNVVLDGRGRAKLIDFGRSSDGDHSYLSRKYDVLNFGVCLREMLAGRILGGCTRELADLVSLCGGADGEFRPEMAQVIEILEEMSAEEEAKAELEKRKKAFKGCFGFCTR